MGNTQGRKRRGRRSIIFFEKYGLLNITLDKNNSSDALLKVALKEDDYRPGVSKKIKELARKATIKGFRKGKVPPGIIQKMYGTSLLMEELNHLVAQSVSDYITTNKLNIIGEPLPQNKKIEEADLKTQKDFTFVFQIGLVDAFNYKLSSSVNVPSYAIEVSAESVDEAAANLRQQLGKVEHPETSGAEDLLEGELTPEKDEKNIRKVHINIAEVSRDRQSIFVGKKSGEIVSFDMDKLYATPADKARLLGLTEDEAAQWKGPCRLTLSRISRRTPATMDQEFFDKVFGPGNVDTVEAFKEKIKENIAKQYARETDLLLNERVRERFIENTKMNIPEDFLRSWLRHKGSKDTTEEALEQSLKQQKKMLKWELIKKKIAEDHDVQVTPEQIKQRAMALIANRYGGMMQGGHIDPQQINALADHYLNDREGANRDTIRAQLVEEHVLDLIKKTITVTTKSVSLEQFKEIASSR